MIIEHAHLSIFERGEDFCALQPGPVPKMLNSRGMDGITALSTFGHAGAAV
jgi:hypothetical protein